MNLTDAVRNARRVYLCGNGGSAANAIHIANDLISVGVKAHALTADVATLTAIANDFGYMQVFSRQINLFGEPGDLLIALSGSGTSANILEALRAALDKGMDAILIKGTFGDAKAAPNAWPTVIETGDTMQRAEEQQLILGHDVMLTIKRGLK